MKKNNLKNTGLITDRKGFTFIEIMITFSLFLLLASIGVGAYFRYYSFSLINNDINRVNTLIQQTRFKSLKNPNGAAFGIHLNPGTSEITGFENTYTQGQSDNTVVTLEQLTITNLAIQPIPGITNEIIFDVGTGKTSNTGSFSIENSQFNHTISINSQGAFE